MTEKGYPYDAIHGDKFPDLVDMAESLSQSAIENAARELAEQAIRDASQEATRREWREGWKLHMALDELEKYLSNISITTREKHKALAQAFIRTTFDARKTFKGAGVYRQKRDSVVAKMFGGTLPDQIIDSTDKK